MDPAVLTITGAMGRGYMSTALPAAPMDYNLEAPIRAGGVFGSIMQTAIPAAALTGLTLLLPQAEEAAQALSAWAAAASVRLSPALRYGQAAWAACAGAGRSWCGPLSRWRGLGSGAALCALGAADGAGDGADMEEKPYARPGCRHIFAVAPALPLSFRFEISVFLPVLPMQNRAFL